MSNSNSKSKQCTNKQATPARQYAYECLEQTQKRGAYARSILDSTIDKTNLSPQDKSFATRLVLGVVATSGTLDELIDKTLKSPKDINYDVRTAIKIAAYEMLFLKKPAHTSVDQGVCLVKGIAPKAAGVANFVLRKISKQLKAFPFGDVSVDIEALARQHGFPPWLADKHALWRGYNSAASFVAASSEIAPVFIAINSLKTNDEDIISIFESFDCTLAPVFFSANEIPGCFWLSEPSKLHVPQIRQLFNDGKILVSDAASQYVVFKTCEALLKSVSDRNYSSLKALELCCGRGTKTILLSSMLHRLTKTHFQKIIGVDNIQFKIDVTNKRTQSYAVENCEFLCADILGEKFLNNELVNRESYNLVFLDTACSGTGTLRRHPEIRWSITQEDILKLARTSFNLLCVASKLVENHGILTFSTCSAEPEENELVVKKFLSSEEGSAFQLIDSESGFGFRTEDFENKTDDAMPCPDIHFCAIMKRCK